MSSGYGLGIPLSIVESAARKANLRPHLTAEGQSGNGSTSFPEASIVNTRYPLERSVWRGIPVYSAFGPLDCETAADFAQSAELIRLLPACPLVLDMASVCAVDGAGLGALVKLQRRALDAGSRLYLLNCPAEVCSTLQAMRMEMILPLVRSVRDIPHTR